MLRSLTLSKPDSLVMTVSDNNFPNSDGDRINISFLQQEINDLKEEINSLKKSNDLYEKSNRDARVGTWEVDPINQVLFWSPVTKEIHAVPPDSIPKLDTAINFFKEGKSRATITAHLYEAIDSGTGYDDVLEIVNTKGESLWVRTKAATEFRDGVCTRIYGTFQDVTTQYLQTHQLANSENKFRSIVENGNYAFILTQKDGPIIEVNPAAINLFGYTHEEFLALDKSLLADLNKQEAQDIRNTTALEGSGVGELMYIKKNKEKFPGIFSIAEFSSIDGESYYSTFILDVSHQKKVEEALRLSKAEFKAAFEYASIGMAIIGCKGEWLRVNKSLTDMLGYSEDELKSKTYHTITHPDDLATDIEKNHQLAIGSIASFQMEKRYITKSGKHVWVNLSKSRVLDAEGKLKYFISQIENINERKLAQIRLKKEQERLIENEKKFRGIFDSTFQFIGFLSPDGTLLEVNETAINFAGLQHSDVVGKKFWDCYWWQTTESTRQQLKESIEEAASGKLVQYEVAVLDAKKELHIILFNLKPLFDEEGKVFAIIPEGRPIQDMVDTRNALIKKNEELEQFAFVASHDLREPLRMVKGFLGLLEKKYAAVLDDRGKKYIDFAIDGSERMRELIEGLLNFAIVGSESLKKESVDMNETFRTVKGLLTNSIEETKAEIVSDHLPTISASPLYMQLLLQNLISNAIKYHKEEKIPSVHIFCELKNNYWQFSIKDNGIGIKKEFFDSIFKLLKRLHSKGDYAGTGLGLSTSLKIVEGHGGKIWVESEIGQGSTFYFTIPA